MLLTPSIVMLTKDSGRPLIRDSRLVVAVLMPGRNVTALIALRVGVGILLIWSAFSVDETVGVCVLISSALLWTVIASASCPTSITTLTELGVPGWILTSGIFALLKPVSEALIV